MEKIKKSLGAIIALISYMLLGAFVGYLSSEYLLGKDTNSFIALIIPFLLMYVVIFIQIIIHEGGHLIFGLISGYKFESFRIGSIVWVKTKDGIKCRRFHLAGTAGQCLMDPPEMKNGSCPYVLYNLGGILANIIISVIAILILYTSSIDKPYIYIFISELAAIGFIFAFLNGIPIRMGVIDNDGCNVLKFGKDKVAMKNFWTQMKINSLTTKGIRLKDMEDELFVVPEKEDPKDSSCDGIRVIACSREIDKMNFEKAKEIGQNLLENSSNLIPIYKYMLSSEIIFCELIGNNNREYISGLHTKEFNKFLKSSSKYLSILRMKYAYSLFFNNDEEEAKKYLEKFNKLAKKYIHQSEVEGERELIEHVNKLYYK